MTSIAEKAIEVAYGDGRRTRREYFGQRLRRIGEGEKKIEREGERESLLRSGIAMEVWLYGGIKHPHTVTLFLAPL